MLQKILTIGFLFCVFGLLVFGRFDLSPQETARVARDRSYSTNRTYTENKVFRRGEIVRTGSGEFLEIALGDSVRISLDENTNLDLKSLAKNNLRVGFGHGRILVQITEDGTFVEVDTPTAEHKVRGRSSFIGYDFKKKTSVIPITGSIMTTIPLLNQTFEVTNPITIHDMNPPTVEEITFDEKTDVRKEFYAWTEEK